MPQRKLSQKRHPVTPQVLSLPGTPSQFVSIGDNVSLSIGLTEMSFVLWNRAWRSTGTILAKGSVTVGSLHEYSCIINATNQYEARTSDGVFFSTQEASTFGTVPLGQWNFVATVKSSDSLSISVNNGVQDSSAATGIVANTIASFRLGSNNNGALNHSGDCVGVGIWKARVLTTNELTTLYNGGVPLPYYRIASEQPDLLTSMVAYWDFIDANAVDRSGNGNNLTLTSGVRFNRF